VPTAFWPLLAFLPFFLALLLSSLTRRACPDCGALLSGFQSPLTKTRRQWIEGGYLCQQCGCEADLAGHKVTANTPSAQIPTTRWALPALAAVVGVGLAALGIRWAAVVVGPPMVAAPPIVATSPIVAPPLIEPPQEAPAMPPGN
jgi:hypothetical protein